MTKPRIFFTSDTHFGDPNIIRIRKRPFANTDEMDTAMIDNWNAVVGKADRVYHLGDFAHRDCFNGAEYLEKLNGEIHLIVGNHDDILMETAGHLFTATELLSELDWQGRRFVLCHYPMRDWPNAVRGAYHLYGHVHSALDRTPIGRSLDVCTESHGYAPVRIETVAAILDQRPQHRRGMPEMLKLTDEELAHERREALSILAAE